MLFDKLTVGMEIMTRDNLASRWYKVEVVEIDGDHVTIVSDEHGEVHGTREDINSGDFFRELHKHEH